MSPRDREIVKKMSFLRMETGSWTDGHVGAGHPFTLCAETT